MGKEAQSKGNRSSSSSSSARRSMFAPRPFGHEKPVVERSLFSPRPFSPPDSTSDEEQTQPASPLYSCNFLEMPLHSPDTAAPVQAKLTVGQPDDPYEQEADRMAEQVMSMPEPAPQLFAQREATTEEQEVRTKPLAESITPLIQRETALEEEEPVQPKQSPTPQVPHPTPSLESRLNSSEAGGTPLPKDVRSFMEPRFGTDLSQVRVHTGSEAVQMNQELNAQAFTHKQNIFFGAGKAPAKDALTAHELTHVMQQTGAIHRIPQIQREDPAQDLNQQYETAKNSGNWAEAAQYLNGFSREDILARLGWDSAQLDAIYKGALNNPAVGPESQVARLAKVRYLDVNFKAAMKAGNWKIAAEFLNGFNSSDIITRLTKLTSEDRAQLKRGAIDGSYPEVAKQILEEPTPTERHEEPEPQGQSTGAGGAPNNYPGEYEGSGGGTGIVNKVPVSQMGTVEKLSEALRLSVPKIPGEGGNRVRELLTPESLLAFASFVGILILSEGTAAAPYVAAVLSAGVIGKVISDGINLIRGSVNKAINAQQPEDLDASAELLARGVTLIGVNVALALILKKGGGETPFSDPPPKQVNMVTPDGQLIRVPEEAVPDNISLSKGKARDLETGSSLGKRKLPDKEWDGKLPAFPEATRAKPKTSVQGGGGLRQRWKDQKGTIYEWDYENGRVEKYNKRGKHLGEFDPVTGEQTKPAKDERSVEP